MNKQKVIGERKVRIKNTEMRVIKWERVKNDNKKKKENGESVCVCTHVRERTMDDICYNYKPNLQGEHWTIYELILHPYIVKTITNIFNIFTNLC